MKFGSDTLSEGSMVLRLIVSAMLGFIAAIILGLVGVHETTILYDDDNKSSGVGIPKYVVAREDRFTPIQR